MKKSLLLLVALLVLVVSFNAFATKLVIWESTGPETEFLNKVKAEYTKKTGVEIEVVGIDQLAQAAKLALDGPAGKGADVVVWPHDRIGQSVLEGIIAPLNLSKSQLSQYIDSTVQAMSYGGKVYGVPYSLETTALIYNKDLMPKVPATIDELIKVATDINKTGKKGFLFDITNFYFSYGFLGGYGGYVFKTTKTGLDVKDLGLANKGAVQGADILKKFRTSGLVPEGTDYGVADGLFKEGKVAAIINGPWAFAEYKKAGVNYGIAPLPKLSNGKYPQSFIGVKGYYVSAFSKQKEEATKFILWLTSKEIAYKHYQSNAIIPTSKAVLDMKEFKENKDYVAFATQASRGIPMPNVPEMGQVWDPMKNAITYILKGEAATRAALQDAVETIKENIAEMKK